MSKNLKKGFINITNVGSDNFMLVKLPELASKITLDPAIEKVPISIKVNISHGGGGPISICCDGACCNGLKNFDADGMRITEL